MSELNEEIEIEKKKLQKMKMLLIAEERENSKTNAKKFSTMVERIESIIEDELKTKY